MILTEGGVDGQSSPIGPGWKGGGDAAKFIDWLAWWDNEIRKDPYILGCTLFQIGDPVGWWSFDLEPIASWLAQHLQNNRATGTVRQARQASNGQAVTISGGVVSAAFPGVLYVQSPDRAHGVRVEKANHGVQPGARVDVSGVARTNSDGEKYIQADWVSGLGTGPVVPLSIRASSLGGRALAIQCGHGSGPAGCQRRHRCEQHRAARNGLGPRYVHPVEPAAHAADTGRWKRKADPGGHPGRRHPSRGRGLRSRDRPGILLRIRRVHPSEAAPSRPERPAGSFPVGPAIQPPSRKTKDSEPAGKLAREPEIRGAAPEGRPLCSSPVGADLSPRRSSCISAPRGGKDRGGG
jgi:hypothetical protein